MAYADFVQYLLNFPLILFKLRFFQDKISQDSNSYYILTMISLVAIVVCLSYVSSEKIGYHCRICAKIMSRATMFRLLSLPSRLVWVPFRGS